MPSFGITIPVRNRKAFTTAILQQLTEQIAQQIDAQTLQPKDMQIIVVDDDSSDGTPELIEQQFPTVHLLRGDGDLWWTGAIAQAMAYAADTLNTDYIIWLNDDITLADNFIEQVVQHCQQPSQKLLTGGIICAQQHPDWIVFGGVIASQLINDTCQFDQPVLNVDTLNGNIAILPTRIIADIGLPDTERFRHYGGDFEYICRAKCNGYTAQLSSHLQATTEYQPRDVIRYMPLWIQWATSPKLADKWRVLKSLSSRRSPHNVEHMVNSIYRAHPSVPKWKYVSFYCRKLVKIIGSELVPWKVRKERIQAYFRRQNIPPDIAEAVLNQS
ncbi:MAG: glycosyltransferase [Cyanobacteria bacterium P01_F01_bin.53]